MLYTYSTEELIGLQDLIIGKIESNEKEIHIYGKLTRKAHCCPNCSAKTDKITALSVLTGASLPAPSALFCEILR